MTASHTTNDAGKRTPWTWLSALGAGASVAVVATVAVVAHLTYLDNGLVWLDHADIERGAAFVRLSSPWEAFSRPYASTHFYRPVLALSLSVDRALAEALQLADPAPVLHATNVLLHALAAVAAWVFARAFFKASSTVAVFIAVVFAVHPLSWLPVGAVSYRAEILAGGLSLLAVAAAIRFIEATGSLAALVGAFALALLSKESALWWVPALCLLWVYAGHRRLDRRVAAVLAALLVVIGLYGWGRMNAVPDGWADNPREWLGSMQGWLLRFDAIGRRVLDVLGFWLPRLSDHAQSDGSVARQLLGGGAVGLGAVSAVLSRRRRALLPLAVIAIVAAPALHIVPAPRLASPHYWYLAPVGLAGWLAHAASTAKRAMPIVAVAALAWIAWMAVVTTNGGPRFSDDVALFAPAVAEDPAFCEGHQYLGLHAWLPRDGKRPSVDDARRARSHFQQALQCSQQGDAFADEPMVHFNLAATSGRLGDFSAVIHHLDAIRGREPAGMEKAAEAMRRWVNSRLKSP